MFETGTQNLILDIAVVMAKLGVLVVVLVFSQRLYARISGRSANGHTSRLVLLFRGIITALALTVLAMNLLSWLVGPGGSLNALDLIAGKGEYQLALPLVFIVLASVIVWTRSANSPALIAPLFIAYVVFAIVLGLLSESYSVGTEVGAAWLSLIVSGMAVFPAILYAEGMPQPTNRILYHFINLGKVRYDDAVHYAARALSLSYKGSAAPVGFSSAEGVCKERPVRIYGMEAGLFHNKIATIQVGTKLTVEDMVIVRSKLPPELYMDAFGLDEPRWFADLADSPEWEPPVEMLEVEIDGIPIRDDYEVYSSATERAVEIVRALRDELIDLDADAIALTQGALYLGYDFSRMRLPEEYLSDKMLLEIDLATKLEELLKPTGTKKRATKPKAASKKVTRTAKATKSGDTEGETPKATASTKSPKKAQAKPATKSSSKETGEKQAEAKAKPVARTRKNQVGPELTGMPST